ncbi:SDR family NAD(P)-dependent oxidoreductase [Conexibacter arvalis]|uniref:NAD(P)-dependent dehydrogenase (Short-subunit alcohol dehydrogenase family) n=1 Tax=Conexibacter arvalis TaxID=912552 RepID=A0A840I6C8_9ACTN|nr:SDR family NAD(P)-dependent oxidoreductase [Conexibacter arvalis]MBB4660439.1 NAD(P)-dependent dehydrogenase (short-subunit alcohol dehydrogenase family) [Conexibacter arvalis]
MLLEGVGALVAGGASGLGRATAEAFLERGADVTVLDLPQARERVPDGSGLTFAAADVRDARAVEEAIAVATRASALRVCVNCAGIGPPARILRRGVPHSLEAFQEIVDVNLVGTFNVMRLAASAMRDNDPWNGERGVIVNTASVAAYDGQIGQAAYAASKGGIVSLTLTAARDLADMLVRCVTIAPGLFETPLLRVLPDAARASLAAAVPHPHRLGDPREYAALATHIVENPMLNGEVVRLDGALRMAPR